MNGLSTGARAMLDAAGDEPQPTDAAVDAVRRALEARLGVALPAASAPPAASVPGGPITPAAAGSAPAPWFSAAPVKWLVVVALVSGGAGVGAGFALGVRAARRDAVPTARSSPARVASSRAVPVTRSAPEPASRVGAEPAPRAPSAASVIASPARAEAPHRDVRGTHAAGAPVAPHDHAAPAADPALADARDGPSARAREYALVVAAHDALAAGRGGAALALLAQADAMFPAGALREERASVRVGALCALGRADEARAAAAALARDAPRSPYLAAVRASCVGR